MRTMTADQIGRFAELLAAAAMSRPVGGSYRRPLFRATHLGEKYPTVDLIVDLLGPKDVSRGFFFAQVKGTTAAKATDVRLAGLYAARCFARLTSGRSIRRSI